MRNLKVNKGRREGRQSYRQTLNKVVVMGLTMLFEHDCSDKYNRASSILNHFMFSI